MVERGELGEGGTASPRNMDMIFTNGGQNARKRFANITIIASHNYGPINHDDGTKSPPNDDSQISDLSAQQPGRDGVK